MAHLPPTRRTPLAAAWALLWFSLRRLRSEPTLPMVMVLTVALGAGILAAAPRLTNRAADDEVRSVLAVAPVVQRNIQVSGLQFPGDPALDAQDNLQRLLAAMPAILRQLVADTGWSLHSGLFSTTPPSDHAYTEKGVSLVLNLRSAIEPHLVVVEGRLPGAERCDCRPPEGERVALTIPIAISVDQAAFLHWGIGDTVPLAADSRDPLSSSFFGPQLVSSLDAEIVGIFREADPGADYWYADTRLERILETDTGGVFANALIGPGGGADLGELASTIDRVELNLFLDSSDLNADEAGAVALAARKMVNDPGIRGRGRMDQVVVHTSLPSLLGTADQAQRQAEAILLFALLGIASVAGTTLALLAVLLLARRRPAAAMLRGRGGSRVELVAHQLVEAVVLGLVGGGGGWLAATVIVPARESPASRPAALAMGAAAAVLLTVAAVAQSRRGQQQLERDERVAPRLSPRRLVAEGLVAVAALVGLYLVSQRGFALQTTGADPFLALAPALAGMAVGLVMLRLYPLPVSLAARVAARGRGLVAALGLERAARRPEAARLPLLAVLLAAAAATFAGVVNASLDNAQQIAGWQALGADVRVTAAEGGSLPSTLDLRSIPGVQEVAVASVSGGVPFSVLGTGGGTMRLIGLDGAAFERVTAGTPAETILPTAFANPSADGSTAHPIPAVTAAIVPGSLSRFGVGALFTLAFDSVGVNFTVVGVQDDVPGLASGGGWVIAPSNGLRAALGDRAPAATLALIRGPASGGDVARAVASADPGATVETRAEATSHLAQAPLAGAVSLGFGLAAVLAAAFAALAVVLGLALSAPERGRDTARLRTMGLSGTQMVVLAAVEQLPPVVVALVAGGAFGIGLAWLMLPQVDLSALTGGARSVELLVQPGATAALLSTVLGVVLVGVLAAAIADRRRQLGKALRVGDE